jgi:outer membrane protein assembly factor BamB
MNFLSGNNYSPSVGAPPGSSRLRTPNLKPTNKYCPIMKTRSNHYLLLSILLSCAICFSSLAQESSKTAIAMYRGNPQLTGESNEQPVNKLNGIKFRFKAAGAIRSTPAIKNDVLYFGDGDGYFYAVDSQSGKERWKFKTGGAVHSSPAVSNTTAWFASRDGNLYALSTSTGKESWKFKMGADLGLENYWDHYLSSPVIEGTALFIGGGDGYLYAFDINTKKMLWKYDARARIRTAPAVSGDHVVFGANSGILYSVDRKSGKLQWKFATDGAALSFESGKNDRKSIFCSPSIDEGVVVSGGRDGIAYGVNLSTGKEMWRSDHKGPWILSTAIKNGVAFIGCGSDRVIQAVDLKTGVEKWRSKAKSAIFSSIALAGDVMYFSDIATDGNLYAADNKTGKRKWQFSLGSRSFSTPVISNGVVYCGTENGILFALQGSKSTDTLTTPRKLVYWDPKKDTTYFNYFENGLDEYIKNYFVAAGYDLVDDAKLTQAMQDLVSKKTPSVIVFADNNFPKTIAGDDREKPLIRKYLDAGGKVAIFGINPLSYKRDTVGNIIGFSNPASGKILDIKLPEAKNVRGIYQFHATKEGEKYGLYTTWTGFNSFTTIAPDNTVIPLAKDEFGTTVEWLKQYGGPGGTGFLQLNVPQDALSVDLSEIKTVVEYGITW